MSTTPFQTKKNRGVWCFSWQTRPISPLNSRLLKTYSFRPQENVIQSLSILINVSCFYHFLIFFVSNKSPSGGAKDPMPPRPPLATSTDSPTWIVWRFYSILWHFLWHFNAFYSIFYGILYGLTSRNREAKGRMTRMMVLMVFYHVLPTSCRFPRSPCPGPPTPPFAPETWIRCAARAPPHRGGLGSPCCDLTDQDGPRVAGGGGCQICKKVEKK